MYLSTTAQAKACVRKNDRHDIKVFKFNNPLDQTDLNIKYQRTAIRHNTLLSRYFYLSNLFNVQLNKIPKKHTIQFLNFFDVNTWSIFGFDMNIQGDAI